MKTYQHIIAAAAISSSLACVTSGCSTQIGESATIGAAQTTKLSDRQAGVQLASNSKSQGPVLTYALTQERAMAKCMNTFGHQYVVSIPLDALIEAKTAGEPLTAEQKERIASNTDSMPSPDKTPTSEWFQAETKCMENINQRVENTLATQEQGIVQKVVASPTSFGLRTSDIDKLAAKTPEQEIQFGEIVELVKGSDPAIRKARNTWRKCITAAGYDAADPDDFSNKYDVDGSEVPADLPEEQRDALTNKAGDVSLRCGGSLKAAEGTVAHKIVETARQS